MYKFNEFLDNLILLPISQGSMPMIVLIYRMVSDIIVILLIIYRTCFEGTQGRMLPQRCNIW